MESEVPSKADHAKPQLSCIEVALLHLNVGIGGYVSIDSLAWYYAGWVFGFLSLIFGSLLILQGGWIYVRLSFLTNAYTAEDLALAVAGSKCERIVNVTQLTGFFSFSIAMLYIAATTLSTILAHVLPPGSSLGSTHTFTVLIISGLLLPFALKKNVKGLSSAALIMAITMSLLFIAELVFLTNESTPLR